MKIISQLKGTLVDGEWNEPRGVLQSVYREPKPGVIQQISLGAGGLKIKRGEFCIGIPLDEIIRLAEYHAPEISAAPAKETAKPKELKKPTRVSPLKKNS